MTLRPCLAALLSVALASQSSQAADLLASRDAARDRRTQEAPPAVPTAPPADVLPPIDPPPPAAKDRFTITLSEAAAATLPEGQAGPGRLILFFIRDGRRAPRAEPMEAPFYFNPQPVASMEAQGLSATTTLTIDGASLAFPTSVNEFEGTFRIQALYRRNAPGRSEARGHLAAGNLFSLTKEVTLTRDGADTVALTLTETIPDEPLGEFPNLKWVEIKSERLSLAQGRDVMIRAGVVFPRGYNDLSAKRRFWPTVYVIPGFGGDHRTAEHYASMMATQGTEQLAPQAVYVIPDPNGPYGHHGFVNAPAQGPRGDALVRELIPELESRFRLVAKPEARIVTGHSSGGWSSLWLQLRYPDVFGACFASAPDPVDFSAFQQSDLYRDANIFTNSEGREQGSFRQPLGPTEDRVMMTVREEVSVEYVLGPMGDSGEQWSSWAAMFGLLARSGVAAEASGSRERGSPQQAFDPATGAIRREVVEQEWSRFDIARLITQDWKTYGPILAQRVRLLCGDRDSYYLNLAVAKLRAKVESLRASDVAAGVNPPSGPGYIELVPRATHETIVPLTTMRWNKEMIDHFRTHGLHD